MPRRRMMDMLMRRDGRRMRRIGRDRGMHYGEHYGVRNGEHYPMDGNYPNSQYADERMRRDYESGRQSDMGYDNADMRGRRRNARGQYMSDRAYEHEMDGHYPIQEGKTYYPIEAMGTFSGYWGTPEDYGYDMGRGRGRDYGYDMNYDYARRGGRDYGYDYAGDYGETLTKEELEQWRMKLDKEVGDEQSKHFFKKENIEQKARQLGLEMKHFNADELALASYMVYSDYCKSLKPYVGQNMDVFVKMGEEFLKDPDSAVKGGEKLALYYEIVAGEND